MQAIILAAGKGERLRPLTDTMPKCMIEIEGKPLILNALDKLSETGKIDEVFIICGYMADIVQSKVGNSYRGINIRYIINDKFGITNNVYSLYMIGNRIQADCLLLECDLFYQRDIIDAVIDSDADCNILVSPYDKKTMNGTIVFTEGNKAKELVIKAHQDLKRDYGNAYKTVNIYRFKEAFFNGKLMPALDTYIRTGNLQSYYELVLGSLIYYGNDNIQITIVDAKRWYEIDDLEDYKRAGSLRM